MISALSIENFRSLNNISIEGIRRITAFSGKNNVGKSTILEALFLLMDHASQNSFLKLNIYRGTNHLDEENLWKPLFTDMDISKAIHISITDCGVTSSLEYKSDPVYSPYRVVGLPDTLLSQYRSSLKSTYSLAYQFDTESYHENGHFSTDGEKILRDVNTSLTNNEIRFMKPTRFVSATVMRMYDTVVQSLGNMELSGRKGDVVKILRQLDPAITDIVTISLHGIPQLYISVGKRLLPLQYAGDGVVKLLNVILAIMEMKDGLVLIDEMETGFHYSMYEKLWKIIDTVSYESNCQVIATTHSYELIKAATDGIEKKEDFAYFRIGKAKNGIAAYGFDFESLDNALKSEMEVR